MVECRLGNHILLRTSKQGACLGAWGTTSRHTSSASSHDTLRPQKRRVYLWPCARGCERAHARTSSANRFKVCARTARHVMLVLRVRRFNDLVAHIDDLKRAGRAGGRERLGGVRHTLASNVACRLPRKRTAGEACFTGNACARVELCVACAMSCGAVCASRADQALISSNEGRQRSCGEIGVHRVVVQETVARGKQVGRHVIRR